MNSNADPGEQEVLNFIKEYVQPRWMGWMRENADHATRESIIAFLKSECEAVNSLGPWQAQCYLYAVQQIMLRSEAPKTKAEITGIKTVIRTVERWLTEQSKRARRLVETREEKWLRLVRQSSGGGKPKTQAGRTRFMFNLARTCITEGCADLFIEKVDAQAGSGGGQKVLDAVKALKQARAEMTDEEIVTEYARRPGSGNIFHHMPQRVSDAQDRLLAKMGLDVQVTRSVSPAGSVIYSGQLVDKTESKTQERSAMNRKA